MKIRALVKKIIPIVDNLTATEKKRLQQIKQIQKLHQSGVSIREITKQLQINRHTEGTNSKLKMIKRTMYGRCSRKLLEAKLMCNLNAS